MNEFVLFLIAENVLAKPEVKTIPIPQPEEIGYCYREYTHKILRVPTIEEQEKYVSDFDKAYSERIRNENLANAKEVLNKAVSAIRGHYGEDVLAAALEQLTRDRQAAL